MKIIAKIAWVAFRIIWGLICGIMFLALGSGVYYGIYDGSMDISYLLPFTIWFGAGHCFCVLQNKIKNSKLASIIHLIITLSFIVAIFIDSDHINVIFLSESSFHRWAFFFWLSLGFALLLLQNKFEKIKRPAIAHFAITFLFILTIVTNNREGSFLFAPYVTSWYNDSQTEFTITTANQLAGFAKLVNSGNTFEGKTINLGANISLKNRMWIPIGTDYNRLTRKFRSDGFKGLFDGKGFIISNLYVRIIDAPHIGLFGENKGTIRNVGITDSYARGDWYVGGLVGYNRKTGNIANCYFSGRVELEREHAGGLVGHNEGSIINSYSTGKVMEAKVWGRVYVISGLVGMNYGTIRNSYSASVLEILRTKCGLACGRDGINSYYDKDISGEESFGREGEGKTTAEMKQKSTFVDWDFENVWGINDTINNGYPHLRVFYEKAM